MAGGGEEGLLSFKGEQLLLVLRWPGGNRPSPFSGALHRSLKDSFHPEDLWLLSSEGNFPLSFQGPFLKLHKILMKILNFHS